MVGGEPGMEVETKGWSFGQVAEVSFRFPRVGSSGTPYDNRRHTAARGGTTDCAPAPHRAADSQPRGRLHSSVWGRAPRTCAPAIRSRQ